jgi:hypothetical protein
MSAVPEENQLSEGRAGQAPAKVVPLRRRQPVATIERIRPELNLEKWVIWQPSKSKNQPAERVIRREITLPDGSRIVAQVEVGFTNKGALTTEDQRTYYALVKHWEDNGRSGNPTYFSLRQLSHLLQKKWGTNVIDALTQSLSRLYATPFFWKNAYYDTASRETRDEIEGFRVLDKLKIIRTKQDGHVTTAHGYFQFNDFILNNLLANHTKPLLLETVLSFKSEIAQLLYTYLDLILADKTVYERRTKELFDDLGLRGEGYRDAAHRKQKLLRAIRELEGAPLTTGRIVSATLARTKSRKDYKIVIRKGPRQAAIEDHKPQEQSRGEEPPIERATAKQFITTQAEELLKSSLALFPDSNITVNSKALDQTVTLIAAYGYEAACYIVQFAQRDAYETKFKIRTFGGILHYTSRAIAQYEREKREEERLEKVRFQQEEQRRRERERALSEKEAEEKAEAYLASLSPEEQHVLYEHLLAEARGRYSYLANWDDDALRPLMKRAMIRYARKTIDDANKQQP